MSYSRVVIGISGKAGSGKDTAALFIAENLRSRNPDVKCEIMSFAEPIKSASKILFGLSEEQLTDRILKELVDPRWNMSPRAIFQWLGTDVLRNTVDDLFFIKNMKNRIEKSSADFIIISDIRFDNEVSFILGIDGGFMISISRPGQLGQLGTSETSHISEKIPIIPESKFCYNIENNGTLDQFKQKIVRCVDA